VPRASTYWKNPEKYRAQRKQYYYANNEYVPRKKKKGKSPLVTYNNNSLSKYVNNKYSNISKCSEDIDHVRLVLEKYYSKRHVSKKLQKMEELGQVFICEGFCFMPLSAFQQAQANKAFSTTASTYLKGEQGILNFIPFIQQGFPTRRFFIIFNNPVHQKGIDFLVLKEGIPYSAIEVTNYAQSSFLSTKDITRYIENLNYWSKKYSDIHKVIVVQYPENLKKNPQWVNAYAEFVKNKIGIKIMR